MSEQHKTMFKRAGNEIIQCVIKPKFWQEFENLGFVDHVDRLAEVKQPKKKARKEEKQLTIDQGLL